MGAPLKALPSFFGMLTARGKAFAIACVVAALGLTLLVGAGFGYIARDNHIPHRLLEELATLTAPLRGPPDNTQSVEWRRVETNLHSIEVATMQIIPDGVAAALVEVGGLILFAGYWGELGYLTRSGRLHPLATAPPTNLAELQASGHFTSAEFWSFRVLDLLAVPAGSNAYDLYVAHHRFQDGCINLSVSRTRITIDGEQVLPESAAWETIFSTRPCIDITQPNDQFGGYQSGGRLVQLDSDRLLLSVGDFTFDGLGVGNTEPPPGAPSYSQDPNSDLGKIIEITLSTGASRIYATGFRNPQGLLVDSLGNVWSAESGPQGGDEVNLIRESVNYGWPVVTYGMAYGSPRLNWPFNPHQGAHDGYEAPRFALTPGIAPSNIIEVSATEFPLWNSHLMMGSLRDQSLYLMRVEGDRIVYAERITPAAERIRDIVSLQDGRIAMATDTGRLILIRNVERHADETRQFTVTGIADLIPAFAQFRPANSETSTDSQVFAANCGSCHSVTGLASVGPSLDGIVGRQVGSAPGYNYSSAMRDHNGVWTKERLRTFLDDPTEEFLGTSMPTQRLDRAQREAIIDYLSTIEARPN